MNPLALPPIVGPDNSIMEPGPVGNGAFGIPQEDLVSLIMPFLLLQLLGAAMPGMMAPLGIPGNRASRIRTPARGSVGGGSFSSTPPGKVQPLP